MDELRTSSGSVATALEKYLASFSSFTNRFGPQLKSTLDSFSDAPIATVLSELESISVYEKKLKQAKTIAHRARNSIPSLVPINALPSDLLAYIFKLVLETQPCLNEEPEDKAPSLLGYPEILSHVCAHWRCVALDSCTLWSHIDIALLESSSEYREPDRRIPSRILLTRANVFAARARDASLGVHCGSGRSVEHRANVNLTTFCATIAPRVKYLDFAPICFGEPACDILATFLVACSPRILHQLVIACNYYWFGYGTPFIDAIVTSVDPTNRRPQFLVGFADTLLRSVEVLRLKRLYLTWTSQAYYGLTELRLTDREGIITQLQLSEILASSPSLCVLHFDLTITDAVPQPTPITLPALKILNLASIDHSSCQALLPLIAPGPEPLHFVLRISPPPGKVWDTTPLFTNELESFFERSNVAELYLESHQDGEFPNYQLLPRFIKLLPLPGLRTLCLKDFSFSFLDYRKIHPPNHPENTPPPIDKLNIDSTIEFTCSKLQVLSFIDCSLHWPHIREVVKALPIQEMELAHSQATAAVEDDTTYLHQYDFYTLQALECEAKSIAAFPQIKIRPASPKMLRDKWDSWPRE